MKRWLLPMALLALAGCAKEPAGYMITPGGELSITIEREKPYVWSKGWELKLIARHDPACQRRYPMKPTTSDKVTVELYTPERGVFILRQGKRWYVTDLRTCGFETYPEPPPEPGDLVGVFKEKDGVFKFVEAGAGVRPGADE